MHLHVTGFSAATILVFAIASPSRARDERVSFQPASNESHRQDHVRLSIGMVWHIP
jgi:hypothetical protein